MKKAMKKKEGQVTTQKLRISFETLFRMDLGKEAAVTVVGATINPLTQSPETPCITVTNSKGC